MCVFVCVRVYFKKTCIDKRVAIQLVLQGRASGARCIYQGGHTRRRCDTPRLRGIIVEMVQHSSAHQKRNYLITSTAATSINTEAVLRLSNAAAVENAWSFALNNRIKHLLLQNQLFNEKVKACLYVFLSVQNIQPLWPCFTSRSDQDESRNSFLK